MCPSENFRDAIDATITVSILSPNFGSNTVSSWSWMQQLRSPISHTWLEVEAAPPLHVQCTSRLYISEPKPSALRQLLAQNTVLLVPLCLKGKYLPENPQVHGQPALELIVHRPVHWSLSVRENLVCTSELKGGLKPSYLLYSVKLQLVPYNRFLSRP